jgi:hypothetical protein
VEEWGSGAVEQWSSGGVEEWRSGGQLPREEAVAVLYSTLLYATLRYSTLLYFSTHFAKKLLMASSLTGMLLTRLIRVHAISSFQMSSTYLRVYERGYEYAV